MIKTIKDVIAYGTLAYCAVITVKCANDLLHELNEALDAWLSEEDNS